MVQWIKNLMMPLLGRCPLHGANLESEEVPIIVGGGEVIESKEYSSTSEKKFPYANRFRSLAGCRAPTESFVFLRFCLVCRKAEKTWFEERGEVMEGLKPFDREGFAAAIREKIDGLKRDETSD